jgi:hypothetical protein
VGVVRLVCTLAASVAVATCAAPATAAAPAWRTAGNAICVDFYDDLAVFSGQQDQRDTDPAALVGMARLIERKDARLARLHPSPADAKDFRSMISHDRGGAHALRQVAHAIAHRSERGLDRFFSRYERDTRTAVELARKLKLDACAGRGADVVTGPAAEL